MRTTALDCNLDGEPLLTTQLHTLSSDEIVRVVGNQSPGGQDEDADDYSWSFQRIRLEDLRCCNEDGEEPEGGWKAAFARHLKSDAEAVAAGSPEYAGRAEWIEEWCKDTAMYPIFVVVEDGQYRIWDGYHRLAGAFWHGIEDVAAFVGAPKLSLDLAR